MDDLSGIETEIEEYLQQFSPDYKLSESGVEYAIADFFSHDFSQELKVDQDLEQEIETYLNTIGNWLQMSDEQSNEILENLTVIYKKHIAKDVLVDGKTELNNKITIIITAVTSKIQKEVKEFGWDELQKRVEKVFMNVLSIFSFQSVEVYIQEIIKVILYSFVNFMKLTATTEDEIMANITKAKQIQEILINVILLHDQNQPIVQETQKARLQFFNTLMDQINYLRMDQNGQLTEYQQRFISEVLGSIFTQMSQLQKPEVYKKFMYDMFYILAIMPPIGKQTKQKTTLRQSDLKINVFPCMRSLLLEKITKNDLISIPQDQVLENKAQQFQLVDFVATNNILDLLTDDHMKFLLDNLRNYINLPVRMTVTQNYKLPILQNSNCSVNEDTYEILNNYYNDWSQFKAEHQDEILDVNNKMDRFDLINKYDDELVKR